MLITETEIISGREFTHNYSDAGYMIEQNETGILYADALDITPCPYTYTETDIPIEPDQIISEENLYAEAGRIMLGEMI
jgi:hypothetical protein